ncbi:MAG TPA: hypothetical protein VJZ25_06405, partial [Gemmatimonadaceae bacterium]|nr:hypothetical protein [Gemmatimonadaceae bacterium]
MGQYASTTTVSSAQSRAEIEKTLDRYGATSFAYGSEQTRAMIAKEENSFRETRRNRLKAYGRFDTGLVDAEPVREHMMMLAEFGMGYKRVARIAGIGITPTRNIIWGRQDAGPRNGEMQKRVKRETAEALLAVKPDLSLLAGGAYISSRGGQRRVQALVTRGWSQSKLCAMVGRDRGNWVKVMRAPQVTVN